MSTPSLNRLLIENLRGSVTPFNMPFEKGKHLTIVYGENGTGKSTIADAFDLLGNGNVGSLDTRGIGQTRKYWPSVGRKPAEVKVSLETSAGDYSISLSTSDIVVHDTTNKPEVAVLRRSQILGLIEAQPAERYKEISRFVDVTGVEVSENSLRELILDKKRTFDTAVTRVSENRTAIERIWEQAGSPVHDAIDWAKREVEKDQSQLDNQKAVIDRLISLWDALARHPQLIRELSRRLELAESDLQKSQIELAKLKDAITSDYLDVLEILKTASTYFEKHPEPSVCPLCGSSEKVSTLVDDVNKRIQSQGLHARLESAEKSLTSKKATVEQIQAQIIEAKKAAMTEAVAFEAFCKGGSISTDLQVPPMPFPADIPDLMVFISTQEDKRKQWQTASDECIAHKTLIETLRSSLLTLTNNEDEARRLESLLPKLNQTLEIVEKERKKFTGEILNAISSQVGTLYEKIHPGEGLNKISLALNAAKRASLDISTEFGGNQNTPPQAYFSDSHLDTLGLCVFLALAERETPSVKILVLDDVLGSVDEPHVDRMIEMIYEEAKSFRHCIVTTHYGPWRHKYRWGWLKNGQCQFIELTRWSIQKGISHNRSIPEVERLRSLLIAEDPDNQSICAKAGVILEAILDFLTQQYECSVPRRIGGTYTLGDLLPAIDKKLKKALRVEHLCRDDAGVVSYVERRLEPHLDELDRIKQVRNVSGCHFNEITFDLLDSDAIAFGSEVLNLADALIDHETGWPKNDKSGSYWATAGETRRLYPLKRPS